MPNTMARAPSQQQSSLLLRLPGELRNHIYYFVFANVAENLTIKINHKPRKVVLRRLKPESTSKNQQPHHALSLLATCKQLNIETTPYVRNQIPIEISPDWNHMPLIRALVRQIPMTTDLTRVFGSKGPASLIDKTHLKLTDGCFTFLLLVSRDLNELCNTRGSPLAVLPHRWYYAKLISSLEALRARLPDVKRISVRDGTFADNGEGWTEGWDRIPDGWINELMPKAWKHKVLEMLPQLEDLTVEGTWFARRYRRSADGRWTHWYTGEVVKWLR